jgi:hypothetical protein
MKLEQKYFVPFMIVVALITMVVIVLSSFNFKAQQEEDFRKYTASYDSLLTLPIPYLTNTDSLRLEALKGDPSIVVFWASWSDRSAAMLTELQQLKDTYPDLNVAAALVMDATGTAVPGLPDNEFHYIDGTRLFNELRVPGIPSYILLDSNGNPIDTKVGYREGEVREISIYGSD